MFRITAVIEVHVEDEIQAKTVRNKVAVAMKEACQGAPYTIQGAVSPAQRVGTILSPPAVILPGVLQH